MRSVEGAVRAVYDEWSSEKGRIVRPVWPGPWMRSVELWVLMVVVERRGGGEVLLPALSIYFSQKDVNGVVIGTGACTIVALRYYID